MFVALWEFEVKSGYENRFEKVYGAEGEWADLFKTNASFSETRLLRDATRPLVYVTMDFWASRDAYEEFLRAHSEEYKALDAACQRLRQAGRRIGAYEVVA
jgi:heme-degrading monooxygenase HmoA